MVDAIISGGDRRLGPVAFVRKIVESMRENESGSISELGLGGFKWERPGDTGSFNVEYGFNEVSAENKFVFEPAENVEIGGQIRQGTPVEEIGGDAGRIGMLLDIALDPNFEFAEMDAASIGFGGHLTDYELTYEGFVISDRPGRVNMKEVVDELNRRTAESAAEDLIDK